VSAASPPPKIGYGTLVKLDDFRLRRRFEHLATQWRASTFFMSSPTDMFENQHYLDIIALGQPVVPLLLEQLQSDSPDYWFTALHKITGVLPTTISDAGSVSKMASAWVSWGERERII
jgi:hypothetical protein